MKKILRKLRVWLLNRLNSIPIESRDTQYAIMAEKVKRAQLLRNMLDAELHRYQMTVREIRRCGKDTYYDWCCKYCDVICDKRDGWCPKFEPIDFDFYEE